MVESLEHGNRVGAGAQQSHESGPLPHVPRGRAGRLQKGQRRTIERNRVLGRRARGFERAQRGNGPVGIGVDVHAAVAQPHPLRERNFLAGRRRARRRRIQRVADACPRVARDPRDLARRAREIVHERVRGVEPELRGDRVVLLQREPVGVGTGHALQRDADVEEQLATGVDPAEVGRREQVTLDQSRRAARLTEGPAAPIERLHVAQPARAFLQVGFEHLRDGTRSLTTKLDRGGQDRQHSRRRGAARARVLSGPVRLRDPRHRR